MDKYEKNILLDLSKRVKRLRNEKGVSQHIAYLDTKIHFGRIEQGKRDVNLTTLYKICDYFEIELSSFFSDNL